MLVQWVFMSSDDIIYLTGQVWFYLMTFVSALELVPGQYVLYMRNNEQSLPVFKFSKHPSRVKIHGGRIIELSISHPKDTAQWTMHTEEGPRLYFCVSFGNCNLVMNTWEYVLTRDELEYEQPQVRPPWVYEIRIAHKMDIRYDIEYEPSAPPDAGAASRFFTVDSPERTESFELVPDISDPKPKMYSISV